MSLTHVVIGTRGSALALKQADMTAAALRAAHPELSLEIRVIKTFGDVNQGPIPLDTVGKGWFTKEIEQALLRGEVHLAVHSLKDMGDEMPEGLSIAAFLPREDARDVLVTKDGRSLEELPPGAVIGTDSLRRQVQMRALRPGVVMKSLRGNVPSRLEKLATEGYDAVILAAAGLKRLGLEERITRYFTPGEMTPSPGQGIIALQVREGNSELEALVQAITHEETKEAAVIERAFSSALGGGCKSPVGAYFYREGDTAHLLGMHADDQMTIVREELSVPWQDRAGLGTELARRILGA